MTIKLDPSLLALTEDVDEDNIEAKKADIQSDLNRACQHLEAMKAELFTMVDATYANSKGFNLGAAEERLAGYVQDDEFMAPVDYTQPPSHYLERAYAAQTFVNGEPLLNRYQHYVRAGSDFTEHVNNPDNQASSEQQRMNDIGRLTASINTLLSTLRRISAKLETSDDPEVLITSYGTLPEIMASMTKEIEDTRPSVLSSLSSLQVLSEINDNPSYANAYRTDATFQSNLDELSEDPDNMALLKALAQKQNPGQDPLPVPGPGPETFVNIIKQNKDTFEKLNQAEKQQLSELTPAQQRNFFHLARNAQTREGVAFLAKQMQAETERNPENAQRNRYAINDRKVLYKQMGRDIDQADKRTRSELRHLAELVDMTRLLSEFDDSEMIEQFNSDKNFQDIVKTVEIESANIDHYLTKADEGKLGVFRDNVGTYRRELYQIVSDELAHRPSNSSVKDRMTEASSRIDATLNIDRHPFIRTCLKRISNILGKLLFGLLNERRKERTGEASFWAKTESATKMDTMQVSVRKILDEARRSSGQNQNSEQDPEQDPEQAVNPGHG